MGLCTTGSWVSSVVWTSSISEFFMSRKHSLLCWELFPPTSHSVTTVLLEVMVARRDFCSTLQSIRLPFQGFRISCLSDGVWSQVLSPCVRSTRHMLASLSMHVWSSGARWQVLRIVSHIQGFRCCSLGTPMCGFLLSSLVSHDKLILVPIIQEMMESHSLVLRNPLDAPTHCGAALDIILTTRSLSCHVAVHCGSVCCPVARVPRLIIFSALVESTFPSWFQPAQASPPPCLVRDWSLVVASCHASLTEWHQSVLSLSSSPLPSTPQRVSALDAVFSSLTESSSMVPLSTHARGPPPLPTLAGDNPCGGTTRASAPSSLAMGPGSGSQEDHSFRFLRQQFHSTVRSSRARFWNEWLDSVQSLSHRDPRLASSLIRCTFRSSTAPPNLCNMNLRVVRSSALSAHEAGSHWRAHFAFPPTGNCVFSDDFFQSLSLRFAALTSSLESGRFDAPFSYNELVAALSRCHESAPGADGLPYSAFKVSFPWWRHLLLSFFNLVLRFAVVPSAWKSSLVVPLLKRDGDPASFDSYRPISLASCAFKVFEHLVHARIAPHVSPREWPT